MRLKQISCAESIHQSDWPFARQVAMTHFLAKSTNKWPNTGIGHLSTTEASRISSDQRATHDRHLDRRLGMRGVQNYHLSLFYSQQYLGITICELSPCRVIDFQAVEPIRHFNHVFQWIIRAEQNPIYANLADCTLQSTLCQDTRRSDPEVLGKVMAQ